MKPRLDRVLDAMGRWWSRNDVFVLLLAAGVIGVLGLVEMVLRFVIMWKWAVR